MQRRLFDFNYKLDHCNDCIVRWFFISAFFSNLFYRSFDFGPQIELHFVQVAIQSYETPIVMTVTCLFTCLSRSFKMVNGSLAVINIASENLKQIQSDINRLDHL